MPYLHFLNPGQFLSLPFLTHAVLAFFVFLFPYVCESVGSVALHENKKSNIIKKRFMLLFIFMLMSLNRRCNIMQITKQLPSMQIKKPPF